MTGFDDDVVEREDMGEWNSIVGGFEFDIEIKISDKTSRGN